MDGGRAFIVQRLRDEDDAVKGNVHVAHRKLIGEIGRACRAEAFADQVFRRVPAFVLGDPDADELRDRLLVTGLAPVILVLTFADGLAEAGADGVNEDKVCQVEDGERIVFHPVGGGAIVFVGIAGHHGALRTQQAKV